MNGANLNMSNHVNQWSSCRPRFLQVPDYFGLPSKPKLLVILTQYLCIIISKVFEFDLIIWESLCSKKNCEYGP